jgi:hypothetical protein
MFPAPKTPQNVAMRASRGAARLNIVQHPIFDFGHMLDFYVNLGKPLKTVLKSITKTLKTIENHTFYFQKNRGGGGILLLNRSMVFNGFQAFSNGFQNGFQRLTAFCRAAAVVGSCGSPLAIDSRINANTLNK